MVAYIVSLISNPARTAQYILLCSSVKNYHKKVSILLYVVKNVVNIIDYQMQMVPEKWRWPRDHIWRMRIHEALLSVLTYSLIIILGLQLFPYMNVDCVCFDLLNISMAI